MTVRETRDSEQIPTPLGRSSEEVRVREVWTQFQTWMRDDKQYAATTRRGYLYRAQAAHEWLRLNGHKGLPWATEEALRAHWNATPATPASRAYVRAALVSFFHFVEDLGWRDGPNPAEALPKPKRAKRLPRPITRTDTRKLLDVAQAMGPEVSAIVHLLAFCGLRNAELRGLKWADVEKDSVRVIGKGNKERVVPLPDPAAVALSRWRRESHSSEWVFTSGRNEDRPMSASTLSYFIDELSDIACVAITPHVLRHTYATELLELSSDITVVQEALGHVNPTTTSIYAKVNPGKVAKWAKSMSYESPDMPGPGLATLDAQVDEPQSQDPATPPVHSG